MALTVSTDLTDIDLAEVITDWDAGALDPAKFKQGQNSVGWYAAKNARNSNGVGGKSIAHAAGDHLYWWNASDVIALGEPQTTGTTTASGVTIRVTLSDGAYREWHVAGSDTWDGGWRCFVVDLDHTGTHLYATAGTWSTANNITDVDIYFDLSNSGNIRNVPANTYSDAIRVGTGLSCHNTSAADPSFDFGDIAAIAESTTTAYGVTETKDGVVFCQGRITLGSTVSTNHLDFDSSNETVVFSLRDGTGGFGLVGADLYELNVQGNATATDMDFNMGVKVGTGDTATGRSGTSIVAGDPSVTWKMNWDDSNLHTVTMYGSTIRGAYDGTGVIGVQAGTPTTTHELIGTTFDSCGQVDTQDAVVRNVNFLNSQETGTTFGAFLWDEADTDIKNSLFVNNTNAIEVRTLTADMSFTGMTFSGNTTDVRYEGASNYLLNWSGGTSPSVTNAGAGTLTPTASYDYTLTGIADSTDITILDRDVVQLAVTGTAANQNVGDVAANTRVGQSFQVTTAGKAERVRLNLRKIGTPTDGVRIRLVNGVPGSTEYRVSSYVSGSDLTTSYVEYDVDLNGKQQLNTATTYGFEIERSGANDAANYYQVEYDTTSVHASGSRYLYNASWASQTGDLLFSIVEAASENELFAQDQVSTGSITYTHGGTAKEIEILIHSLVEKNSWFLDNLTGADKSQTVQQVVDTVYM